MLDNKALVDTLTALCVENGATQKTDMDGNIQLWFVLRDSTVLPDAAKALKDAAARLCMISGYDTRKMAGQSVQYSRLHGDEGYDVHKASTLPTSWGCTYHFELQGTIINLDLNFSQQDPSTVTITPWFFNADWFEREMRELVGITVRNQPNPERLFLDPSIDDAEAVMSKSIPLSVLMNGASSNELWEHILSSKGGK